MLASYSAPLPSSSSSTSSSPSLRPASPGAATGVVMVRVGGLGSLLEGLRFEEVGFVHRALSAPEPASGVGYFLSKAWAANYRRYTHSLTHSLPSDTLTPDSDREMAVRVDDAVIQ